VRVPLSLRTAVSLSSCSCPVCRGIKFQAVGPKMEKACSASLVLVLYVWRTWVMSLKEHLDGGMSAILVAYIAG